jgi:hypothetical protein
MFFNDKEPRMFLRQGYVSEKMHRKTAAGLLLP